MCNLPDMHHITILHSFNGLMLVKSDNPV